VTAGVRPTAAASDSLIRTTLRDSWSPAIAVASRGKAQVHRLLDDELLTALLPDALTRPTRSVNHCALSRFRA